MQCDKKNRLPATGAAGVGNGQGDCESCERELQKQYQNKIAWELRKMKDKQRTENQLGGMLTVQQG
jgi:hypothetical protein